MYTALKNFSFRLEDRAGTMFGKAEGQDFDFPHHCSEKLKKQLVEAGYCCLTKNVKTIKKLAASKIEATALEKELTKVSSETDHDTETEIIENK